MAITSQRTPLPDNPPTPAEQLSLSSRAMTAASIGPHVDALHARGLTHDTLVDHVLAVLGEHERNRDLHPKLGDAQVRELAACFQLILEQRTAYHRNAA